MVIFARGKISRLCHQDVSRGGNFAFKDLFAPIPVSWCNFRGGGGRGNFEIAKTPKITPREILHVYSTFTRMYTSFN